MTAAVTLRDALKNLPSGVWWPPLPPRASPCVEIADRVVGDGYSVFVVAEIGINHNASLDIAERLIEAAASAGCDAVKFQKRTPEVCVPAAQWETVRETPWGRMSYIDYRRKMEFSRQQFEAIDEICRSKRILWFASCWDVESVRFVEQFQPPCYKAASASLTDLNVLKAMRRTERPLIISTGMSTLREIDRAVATLGPRRLLIAHSTSTYPCPAQELNLKMIRTLKQRYAQCPVGYSGHEQGLDPTWAAVAAGASFVERHITLDRSMWGTDQSASLEPAPLRALVSRIRELETALGDGVKRVYPGEVPVMRKLRRVPHLTPLD